MRHHPADDLRRSFATALARRTSEDEAARIAAEAMRRHYSSEDLGDRHFELLNVTLKWTELCGDVVDGDLAPGAVGLDLIVGALRWFDGMRSFYQFGGAIDLQTRSRRDDLELDHVEAATCLALGKRGTTTTPPTGASAPLDTLVPGVNAVLAGADHRPVDRERLRTAVDRLRALQCVAPRAGWYGLRDEMAYQVPEE